MIFSIAVPKCPKVRMGGDPRSELKKERVMTAEVTEGKQLLK